MIKIPRVTKKLQAARAAFRTRVLEFIQQYNPAPSNFYEFTIETPIGTMHLSIWESAIMCRFDNVAAAKVFTAGNQSCNPYTGKWNWHYSDDAETLNNEGCEAHWQMCMEKLMS